MQFRSNENGRKGERYDLKMCMNCRLLFVLELPS